LGRRLGTSEELLTIATPHLAWLSNWLGDAPHVVHVVDADGIVLHSFGNDADAMREWGLLAGCDWSERAMGTNGAGTALAANQPVVVIGCEHYARHWHGAT
jgi:transcriptional regulator of acetoin/glycerol metabolism